MSTLLGLLAVIGLVLFNAFFVAAEFALVGARRTRIDQLAAAGNRGAASAKHAIQNLDSYIAATQLGITLASLGLGWIGEDAVGHLIEEIIAIFLPPESAASISHTLALPIAFGIVTTLLIVFGELTPKSIALQRPESTSILVAPTTRVFHTLFFPIIWMMNRICNSMLRLIGFDPASEDARVHSPEELAMLIRDSREAGMLQRKEEQLLMRAFSFRDIPLENIMKPRVDVIAFPVDISRKELLEQLPNYQHSRFVIYRRTIDDVLGVLHLKDLFDLLAKEDRQEEFDLLSLIHEPLYLPASAPISSVLQQMQLEKKPFAIVLDEFGGTAGVATVEDILEELVGEVQDEFDQDLPAIRQSGDEFWVDGSVSISEIERYFGPAPMESESHTIGGYISEALQRIPRTNDRVHYGDYEIKVGAMLGRRVVRLHFRPLFPSSETTDDIKG